MSKEILQQPEGLRPQLTEEGLEWFKLFGPADMVRGTIAGIRHLFNNQLTVVQMTVEMSLAMSDEEKEDILGPLKRLSDFSNKRLQKVASFCDLENYEFFPLTAEGVVGFMKDIGKNKNIVSEAVKFEVRIDEKASQSRILVCSQKLLLAVAELVANSVEAEAKKVCVNFTTEDGILNLSVIDNGKGIKHPEKLFSPDAMTKVAEGQVQIASYGLIMAKSCALAHGGKFEIVDHRKDKQPRNLTVATISLPLLV